MAVACWRLWRLVSKLDANERQQHDRHAIADELSAPSRVRLSASWFGRAAAKEQREAR